MIFTMTHIPSEPLFVRLIPFVLLLGTTIVSVILIALQSATMFDQYSVGISNNRTTIGLIVQLVSVLLGTAQIYALGVIIQFAFRLRCTKDSVSLRALNFWSAMATPRVDFSLPIGKAVVLLGFVVASSGPGAVWAGALTPNALDRVLRTGLTMDVPRYTEATKSTWDAQFLPLNATGVMNHVNQTSAYYGIARTLESCHKVTNQKIGRIYSCPVPDYAGDLLGSAGTASPLLLTPRSHSKFDNASWTFQGRSNGVGSSLGLQQPNGLHDSTHLILYNYTEPGYAIQVECINNNTADYTLTSSDTILNNVASGLGVDFGIIGVAVGGRLPNTPPTQGEGYTTAVSPGDSVSAWSVVSHWHRNLVAIAGDGQYSDYQNVQCEIVFTPTSFQVSVNTTQQTINVTESKDLKSPPQDIETTGDLMFNTVISLDLLSRISSNIGVSALGDPILKNRDAYAARHGTSTADAKLPALEDSIQAMMDDLLVAFGAVQLGIAAEYSQEAFTTTSLWGTYKGIQIGSTSYIFASLVISVALLFIFVCEAARTRLWRQVIIFSFDDKKSLVVAASTGGTSIAQAMEHRHGGRIWKGSPGDDIFEGIRIRFLSDDKKVEMVAASREQTISMDDMVPSSDMVPSDDNSTSADDAAFLRRS